MTTITVRDSVEVIIGEYPLVKELKKAVVPVLENYPDAVGRKSNVKAIMTEWDWDPDILQLKHFKMYMNEEVHKNFLMTVNGGQSMTSYPLKDFWGNVYEKGDYTQSHHHKPAAVSCAYFFKAKWYDSPFVFTNSGKRIGPKEGRYVLFPSHLKHHVPKHRFNHKRMTLSANWSCKVK